MRVCPMHGHSFRHNKRQDSIYVILRQFQSWTRENIFLSKKCLFISIVPPAFEFLIGRYGGNDKMGQVSLSHLSVNSYLISQYPVHCASRAFFPNLRSHSSAIWACVGVNKLDDTWMVVPLGIPARLSFSVHVKTFAM